jgi:DNA-binding CsgD family transcriptional regulator
LRFLLDARILARAPASIGLAASASIRRMTERGARRGWRERGVADPADDGLARQRLLLTLLLGAVAVGGAIDLRLDWPRDPGLLHVAFEATVLAVALGAIAWLWAGWVRARRSLAGVRAALETHRSERDAWRARAEALLRGLGAEIDAQLRRWGLTPAESEVALLLLKGFGHKEIAALLGRSERTVRQHAVAVYRKSGLAGRAELSAFFLEDLLLPPPDPGADAPPAGGAGASPKVR